MGEELTASTYAGPSPYPCGRILSKSILFLSLPDDEWGPPPADGRANAPGPSKDDRSTLEDVRPMDVDENTVARASHRSPPSSRSHSADSKRCRLTSPPPSSRAWSREPTSSDYQTINALLPSRPPPQDSYHLSHREVALSGVVGPLSSAKELPPESDWRRTERHAAFLQAALDAFQVGFELPVPKCVFSTSQEPSTLTRERIARPPSQALRPFLHLAPLPSSLPTLPRFLAIPPRISKPNGPRSGHEKRTERMRQCRMDALRYLCETDACRVGIEHLDWLDRTFAYSDFTTYLSGLAGVRRTAYALGLDGLDPGPVSPWKLVSERVRQKARRENMTERQRRILGMLHKGLLGPNERDTVALDWPEL